MASSTVSIQSTEINTGQHIGFVSFYFAAGSLNICKALPINQVNL